jgi:hypothetical protein
MSLDPKQFEELPESLSGELRAMYGANRVAVPHEVDAAVLAEARAGFARRRRFQLARRLAGTLAGAAAVAAVVFIALRPGTNQPQPAMQASHQLGVVPTTPEDVDRSGRVDILDAFVVAKLVEVGGDLGDLDLAADSDVNDDGKIDRGDVDHIASVAVAVDARPTPDAGVQ